MVSVAYCSLPSLQGTVGRWDCGLAVLKLGLAGDSARSGQSPGVSLSGMDNWQLLHGFRSLVTGDQASGGLGGLY